MAMTSDDLSSFRDSDSRAFRATHDEEQDAVEQAERRDEELVSGAFAGRSHQQVKEAARRVLGYN